MYVPADHVNSWFVSEQELVVSAKGFVVIVLLLYVPVFFKIGPPLSADLMITSFTCLSSLRAWISSCDKLTLLVVDCWYKSVISLRPCLKYFCEGGKMYSVGSQSNLTIKIGTVLSCQAPK